MGEARESENPRMAISHDRAAKLLPASARLRAQAQATRGKASRQRAAVVRALPPRSSVDVVNLHSLHPPFEVELLPAI